MASVAARAATCEIAFLGCVGYALHGRLNQCFAVKDARSLLEDDEVDASEMS